MLYLIRGRLATESKRFFASKLCMCLVCSKAINMFNTGYMELTHFWRQPKLTSEKLKFLSLSAVGWSGKVNKIWEYIFSMFSVLTDLLVSACYIKLFFCVLFTEKQDRVLKKIKNRILKKLHLGRDDHWSLVCLWDSVASIRTSVLLLLRDFIKNWWQYNAINTPLVSWTFRPGSVVSVKESILKTRETH